MSTMLQSTFLQWTQWIYISDVVVVRDWCGNANFHRDHWWPLMSSIVLQKCWSALLQDETVRILGKGSSMTGEKLKQVPPSMQSKTRRIQTFGTCSLRPRLRNSNRSKSFPSMVFESLWTSIWCTPGSKMTSDREWNGPRLNSLCSSFSSISSEDGIGVRSLNHFYGLSKATISNYLRHAALAAHKSFSKNEWARIVWHDASERKVQEDSVYGFPKALGFVDESKCQMFTPKNNDNQCMQYCGRHKHH